MTFPILLCHGIARFDVLAHELDRLGDDSDADDRLHYFRCIRSTLAAHGFDAHHASVSFAEGLATRSRDLRADVERVLRGTGAPKLHLIAHSMGGLDARRMLFDGRDDRLHERIASLTTIGTPHLGTSFADWGVRRSRELLHLLAFLHIDTLDGFRDLTTDACRAFDAKAEPFEEECGVAFQTIAGTQELADVFTPLQLPALLIEAKEGANDGLVPLASATWRAKYFRERIDADHLNQVGWWDPNDAGPFFPSVAKQLASRRALEREMRAMYVRIARDLARSE